ncbi:unnamed protein product [Penicillium egyptiacum]|uniref:Major facilitator superfamily (MFS) profile domain-containing protein n=1 Tax=Penicillium egyptiacum TaxID=1303716 RepID=A0A9W4P782_9EURO|nr:unnamed protein product [Penicillium egyptiacum]
MMNGLQTLTYWQEYFKHPVGGTLGILNAIQSVGGIVCLPYAPYLSDWIGRKKTIFVGCCYIALGAALQGGSQNIGMFIAGRFFIGHGSCISAIATPMLITELCHPKQRGKVTAAYNTCCNWSWRLPSVLQVAPSLVQLSFIWLLPESPRFLMAMDRPDEALDVIANYHGNGDRNSEWVRFQVEEIQTSMEMEQSGNQTTWVDLIRTRNSILDLLGYTDPRFQNKINGIYATTNWVEALFAAFMVDRIGRRPLFLTSNISMVFTFALWIAFTALNITRNSSEFGIGAIVMLFLHTLVYNLVWVSLNVAYPVEILPYHLRAKGLTVLNLSISLASFFGQYVNPVGIQNLAWKYYIVYEVWLVLEVIVVYFYFTETRGATLEEMSQLFDGKDAAEALKLAAAERSEKVMATETEIAQGDTKNPTTA